MARRRPLNPVERADRWHDLAAVLVVAAAAVVVFWWLPPPL